MSQGGVRIELKLRRPHPQQEEFIYAKAKRKVLRSGRRWGKTTVVSIISVMGLLEGRRVLYAAPTTEQLGKYWWEVTTAMKPAMEAGLYRKNETERYIIPAHGTSEARIKAKTAWNANTLRGDYADLLILDEYQLMDPDAWRLVGAPMLLDNDGSCIFIYTAEQRAAHARELYKRAEQLQKEAETAGEEPRWRVFHYSSHDNPHLSATALEEISSDMSSLAYQLEILAEDLDDDPRALWSRDLLNKTRTLRHPELSRIVVGVDPAGGVQRERAGRGETGIVVAGAAVHGDEVMHCYVLEDLSIHGSPETWASQAIAAYYKHEADRIVVERNFGGEMVEQTLRSVDPRVPVKMVTASRGKTARAEPVVALYEKDRVHHVGELTQLENELCTWYQMKSTSAPSPNRLDALVWAVSELMLDYCATELGSIEIPMV